MAMRSCHKAITIFVYDRTYLNRVQPFFLILQQEADRHYTCNNWKPARWEGQKTTDIRLYRHGKFHLVTYTATFPQSNLAPFKYDQVRKTLEGVFLSIGVERG